MVRGRGPTRPTYARELVQGRESLDLEAAVGVAMRMHRWETQRSQREYADWRGWSKSHQWRLEKRAGELTLHALARALEDTGYRLALVHVDPLSPVGEAPAELVRSEQFPRTEFTARDAAGRRFPAHRRVHRARVAPRWWSGRYSTSRVQGPEWTTETAP
ncbi:hypothetical protein [Ornithinimicrobium sediminis]|uniref:hypothetical protein n=1 Tax=Ornithinimicrobium sediminis TaxID=2904603 RepID=UPI001E3589C3|nr:hypothetical protein [Ornithinimicrobium sediminis]MCE0486813.1 hypothetical protein [Ornithinimicrobium sediminis]